MSDTKSTTEEVKDQENPGAEETEQDSAQTKGTEAEAEKKSDEEKKDEGSEDEKVDDLPDWAKSKISKLNNEAAGWRTQLREAQEALSKAKSPEDFEAATKELTNKISGLEQQLVRTDVIAAHKLDAELASLLPETGTKEELEAKAKILAKLADQPRITKELKGGVDPTDDDDSDWDPVKASRRARTSRY